VNQVLAASQYPEGFPRQYQVAYRPATQDVVVEFELPSQSVVPAVREYGHVKTREAISPVPRPISEVKQRYARLIAWVLRTLREVFAATPGDLIEAVVFNGRVSTIDRATGKQARPHLISVEAERADFTELVLAQVDPVACLKRLKATVSANPSTWKQSSRSSTSTSSGSGSWTTRTR
jgi:restriction system protein